MYVHLERLVAVVIGDRVGRLIIAHTMTITGNTQISRDVLNSNIKLGYGSDIVFQHNNYDCGK